METQQKISPKGPQLQPEDIVRGATQLAIDGAGLYFAFHKMIFKLGKVENTTDGVISYPYLQTTRQPGVAFSAGNTDKNTGKLLRSKYDTNAFILKTFLQSIAIGFDDRIAQGMKEAGTDPATLASAPKGEPTPMDRIHDRVTKNILQRGLAKLKTPKATGLNAANFILIAFKEALKVQIDKVQAAEKFRASLLTGDDFIFGPTENLDSLGRRFKALRPKQPQDGSYFSYNAVINSLYTAFEYAPAVYSATCSTAFIVLDSIGQAIGTSLAELNIGVFQHLAEIEKLQKIPGYKRALAKAGPQLSALLVKTSLFAFFIFADYLSITKDLVDFSKNFLWETTLYPLFSGLMMGAYIELANSYPKVFTGLREELDKTAAKIPEEKIIITGPSPSTLPAEKESSELWLPLKTVFINCYKQAKLDFEKYDEKYNQTKEPESRMYRAFIQNAPASKKFMEARSVVLAVMTKGDEGIDHLLTSIGLKKLVNKAASALDLEIQNPKIEVLKTTALFLRSALLFTQLILSKGFFMLSKSLARAIIHPALTLMKSSGKMVPTRTDIPPSGDGAKPPSHQIPREENATDILANRDEESSSVVSYSPDYAASSSDSGEERSSPPAPSPSSEPLKRSGSAPSLTVYFPDSSPVHHHQYGQGKQDEDTLVPPKRKTT